MRGRSYRRTLAVSSVAAAFAATAVPSADATRYAYRNSAPLPTIAEARDLLTESCIRSRSPVSGSVSFARALAVARSLVGANGSRFDRLERVRALRNPVKAEGAAAMAILKGSPKGALAALLVGLQSKPGDAVLLMDAGVMLIRLDKPREGFAFIQRAGTRPAPRMVGVDWQATLDTNRSLAYIALRRFNQAAIFAKRALARAPWLVEARENLASALFCGGRPDEGVCEFRAAQRRPLEEEDDTLTCAAGIARDFRDGDFGDLSTGPDGVLAHVPTPATAEIAPKYVDTYGAMSQKIAARSSQRFTRLLALPSLQAQWAAKANPASRQRTLDLTREWNRTVSTPEVAAKLEHLQELGAKIHKLIGETDLALVDFMAECADADDFAACFRSKCNPLFKQNHVVYLSTWNALNTAVRAHWKDLHARLRGIQRGVEPAAWNEYLGLLTDVQSETYLGMLLTGAGGWPMVMKVWKEPCLDDLPDPAPPAPDLHAKTPYERCPGALNNLQAEIGLDTSLAFGGDGPIPKAGITLKCSSVEVSLSWSPLPLLTGYGKLKIGFGPQGDTSLTFGTKGGSGITFISEVAVRADSSGRLRDVVWNVGPKGPFGKSDIVAIPIVGSATGSAH